MARTVVGNWYVFWENVSDPKDTGFSGPYTYDRACSEQDRREREDKKGEYSYWVDTLA